MEIKKQEVLNILHRLNWTDKSILEAAKKLDGFYGIIKISSSELQYSDSKDWKVSEERALDMLQKKYPRSKIFLVKDKNNN